MESENQTSTAGRSADELRRLARERVDALVADGVLVPDGQGLKGARSALAVCAILAAIGLALGSPGVPTLPSGGVEDATVGAGEDGRPLQFGPTLTQSDPFERGSGLAGLRDTAFAAIEKGDAATARRAAARFLLRPREATPGLRAEQPDVWRILGEALRVEATAAGGGADDLQPTAGAPR